MVAKALLDASTLSQALLEVAEMARFRVLSELLKVMV
jgi:hypothetical protein